MGEQVLILRSTGRKKKAFELKNNATMKATMKTTTMTKIATTMIMRKNIYICCKNNLLSFCFIFGLHAFIGTL